MTNNEVSDGDLEYRERLVNSKINELSEHFDAIRIFVAHRSSAENTACYTTGRGNFHAQVGQVREWIIRQDEYVREAARAEQREENED